MNCQDCIFSMSWKQWGTDLMGICLAVRTPAHLAPTLVFDSSWKYLCKGQFTDWRDFVPVKPEKGEK